MITTGMRHITHRTSVAWSSTWPWMPSKPPRIHSDRGVNVMPSMMAVNPAPTSAMNRRLVSMSSKPKVTKKCRNWFAACWNIVLKSKATRSAAMLAMPSGMRLTKA